MYFRSVCAKVAWHAAWSTSRSLSDKPNCGGQTEPGTLGPQPAGRETQTLKTVTMAPKPNGAASCSVQCAAVGRGELTLEVQGHSQGTSMWMQICSNCRVRTELRAAGLQLCAQKKVCVSQTRTTSPQGRGVFRSLYSTVSRRAVFRTKH